MLYVFNNSINLKPTVNFQKVQTAGIVHRQMGNLSGAFEAYTMSIHHNYNNTQALVNSASILLVILVYFVIDYLSVFYCWLLLLYYFNAKQLLWPFIFFLTFICWVFLIFITNPVYNITVDNVIFEFIVSFLTIKYWHHTLYFIFLTLESV